MSFQTSVTFFILWGKSFVFTMEVQNIWLSLYGKENSAFVLS